MMLDRLFDQKRNQLFVFACVIGIIFLSRMLVTIFSDVPLGVDEIQYTIWTHHLAFGYHSKPPLIAAVIAVSQFLFPDNSYLAVRFFSPICYLITSIFLALTANRLINRQVALWVCLSFNTLVAVSFGSLVMSTDALLLVFWSLGLYLTVLALENNKLHYWLGVGVAIGLGSLAKYTALVFWPSLLLFFILERQKRHLLRSPGLYIGFIISIIVLSPNIIWNAHHHFASFSHLSNHNIDLQGGNFGLKHFFDFIFSQFGVFSPIFFPLLIYLLFFCRDSDFRDWRVTLLKSFSFIMLVAIGVEAFINRAYANWAIVSYASGIILVVWYLVKKLQMIWLKLNIYIMLSVSLVVYAALMSVNFSHLPRKWQPKTTRRSIQWQQFSENITLLNALYPKAIFVFNERKTWAELTYYAHLKYKQVYAISPESDFSTDTVSSLFPRQESLGAKIPAFNLQYDYLTPQNLWSHLVYQNYFRVYGRALELSPLVDSHHQFILISTADHLPLSLDMAFQSRPLDDILEGQLQWEQLHFYLLTPRDFNGNNKPNH